LGRHSGYSLQAKDLSAGYGNKLVLRQISIEVAAGEIVAIVGHNGAGKSTLLKAIVGVIPLWTGSIQLFGIPAIPQPRQSVRQGVGYIAQGNRVFTELTIEENFSVAGTITTPTSLAIRVERVFSLFPILRARWKQRAGTLSGGERQMLAIANCLLTDPKLLLIDEPSLGLSGLLMSKLFALLKDLTQEGRAVLIVEQKIREVMRVADRFYMLQHGEVTHSGAARDLDENSIQQIYL
jgi:branched-chain amino acid transport system ATP-binding protein